MQSTQQQPMQQQQQPLQPVPVAKRLHWFINSPWLLLVVPLLVGGFWVVLNPWIITDNLNKPYALLAGPAFVGSLLAGWLVVKFFRGIEQFLKSVWAALLKAQGEDSGALFFWVTISVFMIVSVFASGSFFMKLERTAFPLLGYGTALFIDLVAVQAMRARLNAIRMRDKWLAFLYLVGVFACGGASAFANVYTSLEGFDARVSGALPPWMLAVAPWFGLIFPLLIVLLSMTADYTVDQGSGGKLEPETYRAQEEKRVKLLQIQRDALRDRVTYEREIDQLTARLKGGDQRVFALLRWLMPKLPDVQSLVDEAQKDTSTRLEELVKQNSLLSAQLEEMKVQQFDESGIAQTVALMMGEQWKKEREAILSEIETRIVVPTVQETRVDYAELALALVPVLSPMVAQSEAMHSLVESVQRQETRVDYGELAVVLAPMVAESDAVSSVVSNSQQKETPIDYTAIAQIVVLMLEPFLREERAGMLSEVQSLLLPVDTAVSSNGHKETELTAGRQQETEELTVLGAEATMKEQMLVLLRQNPRIELADLMAQTGAKRAHASKVRSQFLATMRQAM